MEAVEGETDVVTMTIKMSNKLTTSLGQIKCNFPKL